MPMLRELFAESRFPLGWKLVPVVLYFPVGIILAIIRIFIALQAFLAASLLYKLPAIRLAVLRVMCGILGIFVVKENEENEDESVKIIISNHVSVFDHLAIYLLKGSYSVQLPEPTSFLYFTFNYRNLGNQRDSNGLIENVKEFISGDAIIDIQPEMGTTSGKRGLLKFSPWPCKLNLPLQPVAIRIWRPPFMDISPSAIPTSWCCDVFWFLFVPFTVFKIKFIPVLKSMNNETPEEMSMRLAKVIADDLNIEVTNHRVTDKLELQKRLLAELDNVKYSWRDRDDMEEPYLYEMAVMLKEVLPDVPLNLICKDLAKTKNVNITSANFLEGVVHYIPEKVSPTRTTPLNVSTDRKKSLNQPSTSHDASSRTFHKSAYDRMISFQERKNKLIQTARERYMEKHAINIMNII